LQAAPTLLTKVIITNKITNLVRFSVTKKPNDISVCFVPPIGSGLPSVAVQELSNDTPLSIQNLRSDVNYTVKITGTRSGIDGSLLDPCGQDALFTTTAIFPQLGINQSFNYILDREQLRTIYSQYIKISRRSQYLSQERH